MGTAGILNGISFQFATTITAVATPATAAYGDSVTLTITAASLNPTKANLTGTYSAYIVVGNIPDGTTTNLTAGG